MSKVVIVGTTSSGKTCYFYGMLRHMMRGHQGFSIRVAQKDFAPLRDGIKRLADTSLPLDERFPQTTSKDETYFMDLLYNFKKIDTFEWADYPGEWADGGKEEFIKLLDGASCLLLCIDGKVIQGTEEDIDDIVNDIYMDRGGMAMNNALAQAADNEKNGLPPVCVLITKYDKVSPELRNIDILTDIVKQTFPVLFHDEGAGKTRMVTICPVTLGKDLTNNGKLEPKNVEKPICFANYLIQTALLEELSQQAASLIAQNQQAVEEYKKRSWLGRKINPKPQPLSEEQKQAIMNLLENGKKDLDALRSVIEGLPLYINGEETEWPD